MNNTQLEIKHIPIASIKPNPYQPRKDFNKGSLLELSNSIKAYGIIQPISVRRLQDGKYELVAGERRLRASEIAELETIPAIVVEHRDKETAILAMVENLQRENLNFLEEAEGYNNLIVDHGFTQKELAHRIGKGQSTIANKLRLLKLPNDIKKDLIRYKLTERHGRVLLKLPGYELKKKVLEKVINKDLNVSNTEGLVNDILDDLTMEGEIKDKQKVKGLISLKIYINTIKKAYKAIKASGINAKYLEKDRGGYIEVSIQIPKK